MPYENLGAVRRASIYTVSIDANEVDFVKKYYFLPRLKSAYHDTVQYTT